MASQQCCDAGVPVVVDYSPRGQRVRVGELDMYVTGSGRAAVIAIPDIFSFAYTQIFQVSDRIAEASGLMVAAIDPFHGKPWTKDRFPPQPEHNFRPWLLEEHSWDKVVKADVTAAMAHLREQHGVAKFGVLGFCWGCAMALTAAGDPDLAPHIAAAGGPHPTFFGRDKELAAPISCPVVVLPAQGDPMELVREVMDTKPAVASKCVWQRFDDQIHGFMAARGDYGVPEVAAAATQGIKILAEFYKANLA